MARIVLVFVAAAGVALVEAPAATGTGGWTWPVHGEVITAYSNDNAHPYAGGMHRGIDIAASVGTRVAAARSGRVTFAGPLGSSGITVAVATADGRYVTSYLHLSRVAVERGESVGAGREIGGVGTTGKRSAEQPHLHFGLRRAGPARLYVDPLTVLPSAVRPPLKPVPAGSPHPRRHPEPAPVPVLTPEPSPFHALGWGLPLCVAGCLLLLAAVVGRRVSAAKPLGVAAPVSGEGVDEIGVQKGVHVGLLGEGG
jgi:hypothetical protein